MRILWSEGTQVRVRARVHQLVCAPSLCARTPLTCCTTSASASTARTPRAAGCGVAVAKLLVVLHQRKGRSLNKTQKLDAAFFDCVVPLPKEEVFVLFLRLDSVDVSE